MSGFQFTFAGETDALFPNGVRAERPSVDLHIEVVSNTDSNLLESSDLGRADVEFQFGEIIAGVIALDLDRASALSTGDESRTWRTLVTHELGHILGLGHTENPEDPMFEGVLGETLSAGDRAGLGRLHARSDGC